MGRADLQARIDHVRTEIEDVAGRFAEQAISLLRTALEASVENLVAERAEWFNRFDADSVAALRRSVRVAIERSGEGVAERLRDPGVWLQPTVNLEHPPEERLDHPNHRAWIALLSGAGGLDPVLTEFGLRPSDIPDPGGGRFGLQPQTLEAIDPRGVLDRLWRRYVGLFGRYSDLLRRVPQEARDRERRRALHRWRQAE